MSLEHLVTTVICARNAEHTIGRAVASAASQCGRLVLVDDHSSDATVARARALASVAVVRPATHGTMGQTRQYGLDAVTTPFVIWLDADDEFLPGRVERLLGALQSEEADIAADGVEIVDGHTGASSGLALIPAYARRTPVRLFERMYLPGPGLVAMRTAVARRVGYDAGLHGCEDADLLLRALATGARASFTADVGCRLHAYRDSLSRDRDRQRAMYRRALEKHPYADVDARYREAGARREVATWALVSLAMFRQEPDAALRFIARADERSREIVEPDGPCPSSEAWRVAFARGTAALCLDRAQDAAADLRKACAIERRPEAVNNLGVALARLGDVAASACFDEALAHQPGYVDARANRDAARPAAITTHPFRREPARQDYVLPTPRPAPATPQGR